MATMREPPRHLTAKQWEEAQRVNSAGFVMLHPDKLEHLQGINGDIEFEVSLLKDHFWGYESGERRKIRHARRRRDRSTERRQKKNLDPPPEDKNYYSATDHNPATDEETDAGLRSDADTSSEQEEDEDMESGEQQEENCMQIVGTKHRVDTCYVDEDERVGDDDGDGSYDGDNSDEEMADGDGADDGDNDDNEDDEDTRGLDVPEILSVLTQEAQIQIGAFFAKHPVTREMCHQHVAAAEEKKVVVRSADIQLSDGCYTCYVEYTDEDPGDSMTLVQFLEHDLDLSQVAKAAELYGNLVPSYQSLGTFGPGPLHVWKLVCPRGVPLGRALDELVISPVGENEDDWEEDEKDLARLANMVTDVVKFVVRGKLEAHQVQALGGMNFCKQLFESYKEKLDYVGRCMELMDDEALLNLGPGPDMREILSSLLPLVDRLVATCNAEENVAASAFSPWSLAMLNPNLTTTNILVTPDWTGLACVLDWSGTSIVTLGSGMARVQALLDDLPYTEEHQRQALLAFQAAAAATTLRSYSISTPAPTADVLLQAQAVGHYLTYADIANKNNADEQDHFETMQRRVSGCYLLLWETQHFGLGFAETPNPRVLAIEGSKAETETTLVLNMGHKRTRSGTYIDAETWGAKSAQNGLDQDQMDGTVPKRNKVEEMEIECAIRPAMQQAITVC